MKNKKIVFVHIPKCCGTSIDRAFREHFDDSQVYKVNPIAFRKASEYILDTDSPKDFFLRYPEIQQIILLYYINQGIPYISGHLPISDKLLQSSVNNYSFITVLRDPLERWISHYVYNKLSFNDSMVPPMYDYPGDPIKELKSLLTSWRGWQLAHLYTTMFSGSCALEYNCNELTRKAIENLKKFDIIGLTHKLDNFANSVFLKYGIELKIEHLNKSSDIVSKKNDYSSIKSLFTEDIRNQIKQICREDYIIFEAVNAMG